MYNGFEGGMFCPYRFQGLALNLLVSQGAPPCRSKLAISDVLAKAKFCSPKCIHSAARHENLTLQICFLFDISNLSRLASLETMSKMMPI